jgi:hypothetical protein
MRGRPSKYTKEMLAFLKKNMKGKQWADITSLFNRFFNTSFAETQIKSYCSYKKLNRGIGNRERPVGTEVFRNGNWFVKVTMDKSTVNYKRYKLKHLLLWEKAHGKTPKNHFVIFLDGDPKNCVLKNLCMVSRSVHEKMLKNGLYSHDPETTKHNIAACLAYKPPPKKYIGMGGNTIYTPEIKAYMNDNYKTAGFSKLTEMVNSAFGTSYTRVQIKGYFHKRGLKLNLERGRGATVQVGSEWISHDGYVHVKVSSAGTWSQKWKLKHRLIWEQANGPIPKDKNIIFLDNNKQNYNLENLALVDIAERINLIGFRFSDPELTKTGLAIVRHKAAIRKILSLELGKDGDKRFIKGEKIR